LIGGEHTRIGKAGSTTSFRRGINANIYMVGVFEWLTDTEIRAFARDPWGIERQARRIPLILPAITLQETLEGFRWGADTAGEASPDWLQPQDTDITRPTLTNTRLRGLVDAQGNPNSALYQLEARKVGDPDWVKVPVA
jgi:hypothetical protein